MSTPEAMDTLGEPYPGLRSFRRDETHIFFGREGTISDMVDRLAQHRFLAVTGHSGSGKSSLVRTGLIDALDRGLLVEAGTEWAVADFAPGASPFTRLTAALVKAVGKEFPGPELGLIEAKFARGPMGLVDWLDEIHFDPDTNVLLLVDQFEEIFRYRQGQIGDDIDAFVQLLLASARQRKRRIYVVITMRSDFLGDCARFTDLAETINDGQFLTPRLTREQCRAAIEGPAAVYGGRVEPALVTRMLNDMGGNPDQLPLMQHVLMLLWQEARERAGDKPPELTLAEYQRLGGIGSSGPAGKLTEGTDLQRPSFLRRLFGGFGRRSAEADAEATRSRVVNGALSDHADDVLATLTPRQQALAASLFRALTQSEGAGGRDVRHPIRLAQASAITEAPVSELVAVVEAFRAPGRNFLTPLPPIPLTADTTVDISHESLIRQWAKMRVWVREEFQSAEMYRYIERRAKQWKAGLGNLLARLDLAVARKWRRQERPNNAWAERYGDAFGLAMAFLLKSERHRRWRLGIVGVSASVVILAFAGLMSVLLLLGAFLTSGLSYVNPADEWSDFGVAAQAELKRDIGTNTPLTIPGARVIGTGELETALNRGTLDGAKFLALDVLRRSNWTMEVPKSIYIDYAGNYGTFDDDVQKRLKAELAKLTDNNLNMPLVFFCQGAKCWESYNAVLRALNLGYTKVYWYRGGIASWGEAHRQYPINFSRIPSDAIQKGLGTLWSFARDAVWPDPRLYLNRGKDYAERKQYDNAVDDFTKAISIDPDNADAYIERAGALAAKGNFEAAMLDFDRAKNLNAEAAKIVSEKLRDPKFAAGYVARGNTYWGNKEYKQAIAEYDRAIEIDPRNFEAHVSRGESLYALRDYANALASIDQALALNPTSVRANNARANVLYSSGDYDGALLSYDKAIASSPKDKILFSNRADAYAKKRDCTRAILDLNQAIALDPRYASAYERRGNCYIAKEDFVRATSDLTQAIALDPGNVGAVVDRGGAYLYQQDYVHAIQEASDAIARQPNNSGAFFVRARAKLYSNAPDFGTADFAEAVKLQPDNFFYVFWLHIARARSGQADAEELKANAKGIKPAWPAPVMRMLLGTGTPEDALSAAELSNDPIQRNDDVCDALFYVGAYLNEKGRAADARPLFEKAIGVCPNSGTNSFGEFFGAKEELRRMR